MVDLPPHLYEREALAAGRDPKVVRRAVEVAGTIRSHGGYPIYTLSHLSQLTGAPWRYLRDVVARRRDPYLDVVRRKRNGTTRPISSPEPFLMDTQRWILHHVAESCEVHEASYAYRRNRSVLECARRHMGARWLVKLDIHDFFESVGEGRVNRLFKGLGYPPLLSLELARLCTRARGEPPFRRSFHRYRHKAPYAVEAIGCLPQGAPTSGMLANAAMLSVDAELAALAASTGLTYTRYSDDMTFSAGDGFSRQQAGAVVNQVSAALGRGGFRLHRDKTRVVPPGARQIVLGLLVDENEVRLLPEYKRRLEVHVRGVAKFGLAEHAQHRNFNSVLSMINHVDGGLAFAASVEPDFADGLRESWDRALHERGYPVTQEG